MIFINHAPGPGEDTEFAGTWGADLSTKLLMMMQILLFIVFLVANDYLQSNWILTTLLLVSCLHRPHTMAVLGANAARVLTQ